MFTGDIAELFGSLGAISIVVLFILFSFSLFSWGIIVYKWKFFKRGDNEEREFLECYDQNPLEFRKLRMLAKELPASPSAAVFLGVCERINPDEGMPWNKPMEVGIGNGRASQRDYLEKVVQFIVQNHISSLEAYLPFLATTGSITPFIGLLGTVLGIINAFQEIGLQGTASLTVVAPGVAEALVSTAAGLFAAIPAVVGYNYFLTRIRKTVFRVEAFSIEFLNALMEKSEESSEVEIIR